MQPRDRVRRKRDLVPRGISDVVGGVEADDGGEGGPGAEGAGGQAGHGGGGAGVDPARVGEGGVGLQGVEEGG